MPELRQDPTTNDWVIIARERAKRPDQFTNPRTREPVPEYDAACPFCPGNEEKTPPETAAYRKGQANGKGWWVRAIPNKFGALTPEGSLERRQENHFFRKMDGVGRHEVIIESPHHNMPLHMSDEKQVEEVLLMVRERYIAMAGESNHRYIIPFKNFGVGAGTSLMHPHMQMVATPIVPADLRRKYDVAESYYDSTGKCLFCVMRDEEIALGTRLIRKTEHFVAIQPFASRVPFETWIMPLDHQPAFSQITLDGAKELSHLLRDMLGRISKVLEDPDYNLMIQSAPVKDEEEDYYLWHVRILPKITRTAGFELGSGIYINTAVPEDTAAYMRGITA